MGLAALGSRTIIGMAAVDDPVLGGDFPPATRDEWLALAEAALRGKPVASLVTTTADEIDISPLYTRDDLAAVPAAGTPGAPPFTRGATAAGATIGGWDVRQYHLVVDPAEANAAVLDDLLQGGTSVLVRIDDPSAVAAAIDGVLLDAATVAFDAGPVQDAVARAFLDVVAAAPAPASTVRGSLRLDPVGVLARHGELPASLDDSIAGAAALAADVAGRFPLIRTLAVDSTVWADAGASDGDELAASLSVGVHYLRALVDAGIDVDSALGQLEFTYSASADQFATIAKLRAARRLWARVAEASGASASARGQAQHAVTSAAMMSQRDPWVNLLRTTVACFAAGVGGADAVTVTPFDAALGVSDGFARRLARNIQLLIIEESHLARVIDPAGGSFYVESLTDALARVAWARFQALEADGGFAAALTSGGVADHLARRWEATLAAVARRRLPLTGVSEFPDLGAAAVARPAPPPRPRLAAPAATLDPLPLRRLAAPFEALRDAADAAPGGRPTVFLANLGPIAVHTTRSTWARNLFEVGGIAALTNDGFDSPIAAAAAFAASDARLAVICSSDEVYAERAESTARALKDAGADRVYLAGRPGDTEAAYRAAGVDEFVYAGADVLAVLRGVHDALGLFPAPQPDPESRSDRP